MGARAEVRVAAALMLILGAAVDKEACAVKPFGSIYVGPQVAQLLWDPDSESWGGITLTGAVLGWQPFRDQRDADSFSLELSASRAIGWGPPTVYGGGLVLGPVRWGEVPLHLHLNTCLSSKGGVGFLEALVGARLKATPAVVIRPETGFGVWAAGIVIVVEPTVKLALEFHL